MIDMNLDFLVNAVVCDYPSLASITFRIMKGEELVLNYWNGDGYDWDDHFNPISDKKDKFKEIHAEFKDISFYSKHEDEEVFSDSVIAEKLKNAKIEENFRKPYYYMRGTAFCIAKRRIVSTSFKGKRKSEKRC